MPADELFGLLGSPPSIGAPDRSALVPKSSSRDKANGKQVAEDAAPSEPTPLKESDTVQGSAVGPSSSRALATEASRSECVGAPQGPPEGSVPARDPLEDFTVPPVGTPFGEELHIPSRSFLWMLELDPMLDEIWSEESFIQLSKEPLQANNRDGVRLLAKVRYD